MFYRGLTSNTSLREVFHKVNNTEVAILIELFQVAFLAASLNWLQAAYTEVRLSTLEYTQGQARTPAYQRISLRTPESEKYMVNLLLTQKSNFEFAIQETSQS